MRFLLGLRFRLPAGYITGCFMERSLGFKVWFREVWGFGFKSRKLTMMSLVCSSPDAATVPSSANCRILENCRFFCGLCSGRVWPVDSAVLWSGWDCA